MSRLAMQFFGVRGSHPAPRPEGSRYGGNTASLLVEIPDTRGGALPLLLDGGTGVITAAGGLVPAKDAETPRELHLFLSHLHWDHIQGLPYFAPLYDPEVLLHVHCPRPVEEVYAALAVQMRAPHFPIDFDETGAQLSFHCVDGNAAIGDASLETAPLSHPGGCSALRIASGDRTIVYATDHESGRDPELDAGLHRLVKGCDVLVLDAHYDPDEKRAHRGWGHSSWQDAAELARDASVGTLYLFHHAPACDDPELERRLAAARTIHPRTELAAEGDRIEL